MAVAEAGDRQAASVIAARSPCRVAERAAGAVVEADPPLGGLRRTVAEGRLHASGHPDAVGVDRDGTAVVRNRTHPRLHAVDPRRVAGLLRFDEDDALRRTVPQRRQPLAELRAGIGVGVGKPGRLQRHGAIVGHRRGEASRLAVAEEAGHRLVVRDADLVVGERTGQKRLEVAAGSHLHDPLTSERRALQSGEDRLRRMLRAIAERGGRERHSPTADAFGV